MELKQIQCPLCQDVRFKLVNRCRLSGVDSPLAIETLDLVACLGCGLWYVNPQPVLQTHEYERIYAQDYFSQGYMRFYAGRSDSEAISSNESFSKRLDFIERNKKPGRLLGIGCAAGGFLAFARDRGWQVQGVEISGYAAQIARKKYHLDVVQGTLERAAFGDRFFDCVCLGDILEHIAEPFVFLEQVKKVLKDDGVVYVACPNAASLYYKLFSLMNSLTHKNYFVLPHHLLHFSPRTLSRLMRQADFEVICLRMSHSAVLHRGFKKLVLKMLEFLSILLRSEDRIMLVAAKTASKDSRGKR